MMAKEPERRFQTPADVVRELTPFFKKAVAVVKSLDSALSKNDQTREIERRRSLISVPNESIPNSGPISKPSADRSSQIAVTGDRQGPDDASETARVLADALAFPGKTQRRTWRSVVAGALVLGLVVALTVAWILRVKTASSPQQKKSSSNAYELDTTKAIREALEKVISMDFEDETPFEDGLKYIKEATKGPGQPDIPIYVDPVGLSEADKTMASPFRNVKFDRLRLKTTLRNILGQLNLDYCVKDGVLFISSAAGVERERKDSPALAVDATPETQEVLQVLEMPIGMAFQEETPLENVIKFIQQATKAVKKDFGLQIYLDPDGLSAADKTKASPVRMLDLEGVPLKTTLRLLLRQLDLAFYVEEGELNISNREAVETKLKGVEEKDKAELNGPAQAEDVQRNSNTESEAGGLVTEAAASKFVPLFDGTQNGWEELLTNGSKWKVSGGILEGKGGGIGKPALLIYKRQTYADFRLRVQFSCPEEGWGWIEVRRSPVGDNTNGYMVYIGSGATTDGGLPPTGSITKLSNYAYGTGLAWEKRAESDRVPVNEWRTLEIVALRSHIISSMNGKTLADYTDAVGSYGSGGIAIAARGDSRIQFKDIRIEELGE